MAIAFDNATLNSGTASGANFGYTTGSLVSGYMLIGIGVGNGVTISSCTYNGVAASTVGVSSEVNPGGQKLFLYYLPNPASGANNVVIVTSNATGWEGMVATYAGVVPLIPEANNTVTNTGSPISVAVTTLTDNAWVSGFFRNGSGNNVAGANTVIRGGSSPISFADTNAAQTPAGSHSLNVTFAGGGVMGAIVVSLAPSTTSIKTINGLARGSVKTVDGLASGSLKTWDGLA